MRMKSNHRCVLSGFALLVFAMSASAVPVLLNPVAVAFNGVADTGALPAFTIAQGPTVLPNNPGSPASPLDGTVTEAVYRDNATGFLDFVYQLNTTAEAPLSGVMLVTLNNYNYGQTTFDTAGYFDPGTEPAGFVDATAPNPTPDTANQTINFSQIHFMWNSLPVGLSGQGLGEGTTLVVFTKATSFGSASILVQDDGQLNVQGFAPTPEPAYAGLLLGGLFGLGLLVARRFQTRQSYSENSRLTTRAGASPVLIFVFRQLPGPRLRSDVNSQKQRTARVNDFETLETEFIELFRRSFGVC
jgi:hypothetical protein